MKVKGCIQYQVHKKKTNKNRKAQSKMHQPFCFVEILRSSHIIKLS